MPGAENIKIQKLVSCLLTWYAAHARDLPWRRTGDPYAIWVSEIMLQQTQVKTVIPFWEHWLRELPTIEDAARAPSAKIHKLWEGLGYYTRVRNLQKAAQLIVEKHGGTFPESYAAILELPGIGRYTAGAIASIAFNQPAPILDGNVIRVLTRVFGIADNPKEKVTNARLWHLAEKLVQASRFTTQTSKLKPQNLGECCSHLNQSLMELGALVCTPRQPDCGTCPVQKLCIAFKTGRVEEWPNLGKREAATARHFYAFVLERDGQFLVRQRPAGAVNAHLWEFPNAEVFSPESNPETVFHSVFGHPPPPLQPLATLKHSITRYRITVEAFAVPLSAFRFPLSAFGLASCVWKTPAQLRRLAFTAAHKKLASAAMKSMLSGA